MNNLTTQDKAALIAKLQSLPGLTDEEKANLIGLLNHQKKYGLVWENKTEEAEQRLRDCLPVLREVKERAIVSEQGDASNHIIIEGDNLEALTALSYTHEGKVDVIYIDPPYNTGNKDFVYNDKFVDSEDDYRHSKWLSFMHKRLKIARRLLSERGVIFISIDDNEQANLKLLCDEVFGEKNFEGHIHWRRRHNQPNDKTKMIGLVAEHILTYSYNKEYLRNYGVGKIPITAKFSNPDNDPRGEWASKPWKTGSNQGGSKYKIISPSGKVYEEEWMGDAETYEKLLREGRIYFPNKGNGLPRKKYYKYEREEEGQCANNWWSHEQFGHNQGASSQLEDIFQKKNVFNNPKPTELVCGLINIANASKDNCVLDFFAGSGTTLHAVMKLNAEDGGKRKCILVNISEGDERRGIKNICEQITYERNKRVIRGYTTPRGEQVKGLAANTLRYYKTDLISRDRTPRNMRALMDAATDLLCIKEDMYSERKVLGEMQLEPRRARLFCNRERQMLVIYDEQCAAEIAGALQGVEVAAEKIKVYIFSPGRYAFDDEFAQVQDKVELVALPAAIYDAYQRVLPKRRDKQLSHNEQGGEQ